jgi:hypothetical protein
MNLDQQLHLPPCARCGHPNDWHRHDDMTAAGEAGHGSHGASPDGDPYVGCPFRCVGYDVWSSEPPPLAPCTCPNYQPPRIAA